MSEWLWDGERWKKNHLMKLNREMLLTFGLEPDKAISFVNFLLLCQNHSRPSLALSILFTVSNNPSFDFFCRDGFKPASTSHCPLFEFCGFRACPHVFFSSSSVLPLLPSFSTPSSAFLLLGECWSLGSYLISFWFILCCVGWMQWTCGLRGCATHCDLPSKVRCPLPTRILCWRSETIYLLCQNHASHGKERKSVSVSSHLSCVCEFGRENERLFPTWILGWKSEPIYLLCKNHPSHGQSEVKNGGEGCPWFDWHCIVEARKTRLHIKHLDLLPLVNLMKCYPRGCGRLFFWVRLFSINQLLECVIANVDGPAFHQGHFSSAIGSFHREKLIRQRKIRCRSSFVVIPSSK